MPNHKIYLYLSSRFQNLGIVPRYFRPCATRPASPSENLASCTNLQENSFPRISSPTSGMVDTIPKRALAQPPFVVKGVAGCAA